MFFVSQKERMFFVEHLSLMIKGGIPIAEALETLKREAKSRIFRKALNDVSERILEGESLNKSMRRHPKVFNKFFRSVVRVGEESGTLEENLRYLSSSLRSEYSLRRKILGALIYPILIILIALTVVSIIVLFILPKLLNLFQALEVQLPLATRALLNLGGFLQKYWLFILVGIFLYFLILRILQIFKFIRLYLHSRSISFPFFGQIEKNRNLAEFSRIFYTLLKSGVPILEAFDICIDTLKNEVYKKKLLLARSGVEKGEKISQGLKRFPESFPLIFSQMVLVGERTGTLEESFLYLSEFYEKEVDSAVKNISGLLEPVLLILVGLFVGFVVLAIITPIYQFTTGLRIR
ncbi:MAG: type II secretion system F family protein [Candidatus Paceibacterales bacterium]